MKRQWVLWTVVLLAVGCVPGHTGRPGVGRLPVVDLQNRARGYENVRLRDITVTFNFIRHGSALELRGQVRVNSHLRVFQVIRRLQVWAIPVNPQGRALGSHRIAGTALAREMDSPITFETSIPFPPEATGLALRYNGVALAPGDDPRWDSRRFFN